MVILYKLDIQKIVTIEGKVIEIYDGVIYRNYFERTPFEKFFDELYALRQKYKDDNIDVMQLLVGLIMAALYGQFLRKDILESYECKSEAWMMFEYDEKVLDYHTINFGNYIVKLKDDKGVED